METSTMHAVTKKERPVFMPTSSDCFYLGSQDTPLVQQAEPMKRPYIGPFNDKVAPAETITNQSEDHNWRWRKKNSRCTEEAVFKENWPYPRAKGKHRTYINKQRHSDESVNAQVSKKTDVHQVVDDMDNSLRGRLRALHLPMWIPIRDEPDKEPQRPLQGRPDTTITGDSPPD
jgi:hypothetical protein